MVIADSIDAIYQSLWTPSTGCTFLIVNVDFLFSTIATLIVVQYVYPHSPLNCGCVTKVQKYKSTKVQKYSMYILSHRSIAGVWQIQMSHRSPDHYGRDQLSTFQ